MSSRLHDLPSNCLMKEGLQVQSFSTTTTGPSCDMITADGRCNLLTQISTSNLTTQTIQVMQSTDNVTFTDITGASMVATTNGVTGFTFERDARYLKVRTWLTGTTGFGGALLLEQLKNF